MSLLSLILAKHLAIGQKNRRSKDLFFFFIFDHNYFYGFYILGYSPLLPRCGVRPLGWTVSGCGFDRLPGVLILELYRAQISECGV